MIGHYMLTGQCVPAFELPRPSRPLWACLGNKLPIGRPDDVCGSCNGAGMVDNFPLIYDRRWRLRRRAGGRKLTRLLMGIVENDSHPCDEHSYDQESGAESQDAPC